MCSCLCFLPCQHQVARLNVQGDLEPAREACLQALLSCVSHFQAAGHNADILLEVCRDEVAEQLYMQVGGFPSPHVDHHTGCWERW